ncbi:Fe(2+) transporter [Rhizopus stolonifer]|uniref:Fe(2+) transporter n=1 Tax=Rhizopus stolonifer TaxID=4846 RepID=A0A367KVY6_RHIST|nr:Fe(2+) transporter [Rhizopus stolonifer]
MEQIEYDYESLGNNSTMAQNAIAGALAGIGEHSIMYPVDSIRTRMQVLSVPKLTLAIKDTPKKQLKKHRNLWRGVYSVIVGAGPAHAVHFATYEYCKEKFNVLMAHNARVKLPHEKTIEVPNHLLVSAAAGAIATFSHDFLMTPFDVRDCAKKVYRNEGLRAFYISFPTTLSMSIPFQSVQFATYDYFRSKLQSGGEYSPKVHMISGAVSGAVASSITTPLDVIKTLLQTRGSSQDLEIRNAKGFRDATNLIYGRHGISGFFRGYRPRILANMPSTAISWSVYEYFKWFLANEGSDF